jgi:hypothetical protein
MRIARIALFRTSSSCIDVYTGEDSIHPGAESCCTIPNIPGGDVTGRDNIPPRHHQNRKGGEKLETTENTEHAMNFQKLTEANGRTQVLSCQCSQLVQFDHFFKVANFFKVLCS